jgi:hypothetical protein
MGSADIPGAKDVRRVPQLLLRYSSALSRFGTGWSNELAKRYLLSEETLDLIRQARHFSASFRLGLDHFGDNKEGTILEGLLRVRRTPARKFAGLIALKPIANISLNPNRAANLHADRSPERLSIQFRNGQRVGQHSLKPNPGNRHGRAKRLAQAADDL